MQSANFWRSRPVSRRADSRHRDDGHVDPVTVVLIGMAVVFSYLVTSRPYESPAFIVAYLIVESFDNLVFEIVGRRHAIVATLAGSLFCVHRELQHRRPTAGSASGDGQPGHDLARWPSWCF